MTRVSLILRTARETPEYIRIQPRKNCTSSNVHYGAATRFEATFDLLLTEGGQGITFPYDHLAAVCERDPRICEENCALCSPQAIHARRDEAL